MSGTTEGWVYYMKVAGHIKIGFASDVRKRMSNYPPGTVLLAVEPGSPAIESARLAQFAADLTWGNEWFRHSPEINELVTSLVRKHGLPSSFKYSYSKKTPVERPGNEWLTIEEAAARLNVSTKSVRRYVSAGLIAANRIGPRLIRIDGASLAGFGRPLTPLST